MISSTHLHRFLALPLAALIILTQTSCNIFDPIDSPHNDVQLLSQCRALFDQSKVDEAADCYASISTTTDQKLAEEAFVTLNSLGVSMSTLMTAIGDGKSGGAIITRMADLVGPYTNGAAARKSLWTAYNKVNSISGKSTKGLVRFITSIAILAFLLAELNANGTSGQLDQADFVTDPTTCKNNYSDYAACVPGIAAGCGGPSIEVGTGVVDLDSGQSVLDTPTPTMYQMLAAVSEISQALSSDELGGSGKFGSKITSLADTLSLLTLTTHATETCFRYQIISESIGAAP